MSQPRHDLPSKARAPRRAARAVSPHAVSRRARALIRAPALLVALALLPAAHESAATPRELLRNADFSAGRDPSGARPPADWQLAGGRLVPHADWPVPAENSAAVHDAAQVPGDAGVVLATGVGPATARLRQVLQRPPRGTGRAVLTGRVRVLQPGPGSAGGARLGLAFLPQGTRRATDGELPADVQAFHSAAARRDGAWTAVQIDVPAPKAGGPWQVWCEVGGGVAQFADLALSFESTRGALVAASLVLATGAWILEAVEPLRDPPWIDVSIPAPHGTPKGGQAPLLTRVLSDPPDAVTRVELLEEDGHAPLRIHLRELANGELVRLRAETLVLLGDHATADGRGVRLPTAITPRDDAAERARAFARLPEEVRPFVAAAPGIDPDSDGARQAAASLRRRDVGELAADLAQLLEYKFSHSGDGEDRNRADARLAMARAAGMANAAVALLLAHGVPARLLACLPVGSTLQEHYLVELWAPGLGWARLDPAGAFPVPSASHVVLRVVRPEHARTAENVPLFLRASAGLSAHFDMDPLHHAWQASHARGTSALAAEDLTAVLAAARDGFRPQTGATPDASGAVRIVWLPAAALDALPVERAPGLHAVFRAELEP